MLMVDNLVAIHYGFGDHFVFVKNLKALVIVSSNSMNRLTRC